jgi:hypothetical protein
MIMSAGLTIGQSRPPGRAIARQALAALCRAWTVHTLKRAIADVASTSDRDYRAFGFDKAELLAALRRLRDELEGDGTLAPTHAGRNAGGSQLAIVVTKRTAGTLVSPGPTVSETSTARDARPSSLARGSWVDVQKMILNISCR